MSGKEADLPAHRRDQPHPQGACRRPTCGRRSPTPSIRDFVVKTDLPRLRDPTDWLAAQKARSVLRPSDVAELRSIAAKANALPDAAGYARGADGGALQAAPAAGPVLQRDRVVLAPICG